MDMINIGYSGASTAQVELNVTAQNTANAMTTGYTRQVAEVPAAVRRTAPVTAYRSTAFAASPTSIR